MLNLLCDEGMRSVPLNTVQRVRFLNAALDGELRRALAVLANSHNSQKKNVSLQFAARESGQSRSVMWWKRRCGRAVIGSCSTRPARRRCKAGPSSRTPRTRTGRTWRMALVSSRPISFQMDLYPAAVRAASGGRTGALRFAASAGISGPVERISRAISAALAASRALAASAASPGWAVKVSTNSACRAASRAVATSALAGVSLASVASNSASRAVWPTATRWTTRLCRRQESIA